MPPVGQMAHHPLLSLSLNLSLGFCLRRQPLGGQAQLVLMDQPVERLPVPDVRLVLTGRLGRRRGPCQAQQIAQLEAAAAFDGVLQVGLGELEVFGNWHVGFSTEGLRDA